MIKKDMFYIFASNVKISDGMFKLKLVFQTQYSWISTEVLEIKKFRQIKLAGKYSKK